MHLYHVHTKINIPSINNVDKCPRQQHHVNVISLLTKKAALMLEEQHGQIQSTMDRYFWRKTANVLSLDACPFL